jgi:hypothetical protein
LKSQDGVKLDPVRRELVCLTWSRVSSGFPVVVLAAAPAHPATNYAAVDQRKDRIIRSTDSGRTWAIAD